MPDEPDRMEKGVRLGCGLAVGAILGLFAAVRVGADNPTVWLGIVAVVALLFAFGALLGGDDFWHWFFGFRR
jgi:hypothetical protein